MNRLCLVVALTLAPGARADEDKVPSEKRTAGGDEKKEYYLIGAEKDRKVPKDGFGLVVILPGGDGSADFHPFVKRIYKNAVPEGYLLAQPVAVKWAEGQEIVWPTDKNRVEGMKFSTEAFVGYIEGVHFPPGSAALDFSTAKGLSPGDSVGRLHQLYGPVPIRQDAPRPGQIATKLFTISGDRTSDKLSGVLEAQGNKTVVTAIFAGELC